MNQLILDWLMQALLKIELVFKKPFILVTYTVNVM
jgi:hypothetical protein